ncbi:MAG: acyltransferase family protein [Actinomycetota bacterium]|jgi:hypothetical protein
MSEPTFVQSPRATEAAPYRARITYQPALDGLRAIAVTMVLLFHGGISWMSGGYFGVSVFFTLSGFLITSLLCSEFSSTQRVAPGAFYMRRAKRLLPASIVCLSVVSIMGSANAWTAANHVRRDLLASLFQVANWVRLFAGESYVDAQSASAGFRSPLDHYWSLAIEEQFYWVWPLAFWGLARWARRRCVSLTSVVCVCAAIFAASAPLIAAVWGSDAAYWATPARAGEILLGALVAVLLFEGRVRASRWMAPLGLALVLTFAFVLPTASGPAYSGGFPVLALASAVLLLGLQCDGVVRSLLSWRPFVALGRISYGVYLYHLPVFVFMTSQRTGLDGWALLASRFAVTLAIAIASYQLIEQPIRRATWAGLRTAATAALATVAVALLVAAVPAAAGSYWVGSASSDSIAGIPVDAPTTPLVVKSTTADTPASSAASTPAASTVPALPKLSRPVRILVVGDSIAEATGHGLVAWAAAHPTIAQVSLAVSAGCGFVRGGEVPTDDNVPFQHNCDLLLDGELPTDLKALRPDVVMMLVWARDQAPRMWHKSEGALAPSDSAFASRLQHDYRSITNEITSISDATVVWIRPPKGDPYWLNRVSPFTDESEHAIVEGVMHQVAKEFSSRAEVLDLRSWMEADGIALDHAARPDGLHFSIEAATDVATRWLGPQLVLAAARAAGTPSP